MKTFFNITILLVVAAVSVLAGCAPSTTTPPPGGMPPLKGGVEGKIVEVGYQEFLEKKTITREIETTVPGSIVVSLASNPTTGFSWAENTVISDPSVIKQVEHNYVAPTAGSPPGSPGKDVWTLDSLKAGTASVTMSYSRPWEGGEKNEWTFTLNVTILPNK